MCGQCALPATAYACPMTCPKQMRNGPCGGVNMDGGCEVYPEMRCVWLMAYERAEAEGRVADLRRLQRPIDQRKWGESSWINYWQGRDEALDGRLPRRRDARSGARAPRRRATNRDRWFTPRCRNQTVSRTSRKLTSARPSVTCTRRSCAVGSRSRPSLVRRVA